MMDKKSDPAKDQEVRKTMIGGSDAPVINRGIYFGKSTYQLYLEKLGVIEPENLDHKENVYWGSNLESVVADEFAVRTGMKVRRVRRTLRHSCLPYIGAHIDRKLTGIDEGLECKTASAFVRDQWGETGTDEIPPYYRDQINHYLAVTGWNRWWCAVLIGGNEFRWYEIGRDEEAIADLLEKEIDFWRRLQEQDPPAMQTEQDCDIAFPKSNGTEVVGDMEDYTRAIELLDVNQAIKTLKTRKESLQVALKASIGDGDLLVMPDGLPVAMWRTSESGRRTFRLKLEADQ
jgi:putative phage-type endonuclease